MSTTTKAKAKPFNFMRDDPSMRKVFNRTKEISYVLGIFVFTLFYNIYNISITRSTRSMIYWGLIILFAGIISFIIGLLSYNSIINKLRTYSNKEIDEVDVRNAIYTGFVTGFGVPLVIALLYHGEGKRRSLWWFIAVSIVFTLFITEQIYDKKFNTRGLKNIMLFVLLSLFVIVITLNTDQSMKYFYSKPQKKQEAIRPPKDDESPRVQKPPQAPLPVRVQKLPALI
jgi:uncharacterized membrane protein